jgi:hypothetical protein
VSCEVCGGADASEGWLVKGAAFGEKARLTLCPGCSTELGLAVGTSAGLVPTGREPSWHAVGWLVLGVVGFLAMLTRAHLHPVHDFAVFVLGAMSSASIYRAVRLARAEDARVLEPVPRRPAIDPALERTMSNTKLLAHLRAVSDFPEEDFLMLRPNSALARKLQAERAKRAEPPPEIAAYIDAVVKDCPDCDGNVWCDRCLGKPARGSVLVCANPRMNAVVEPVTGIHPYSSSCVCPRCRHERLCASAGGA